MTFEAKKMKSEMSAPTKANPYDAIISGMTG
jgi:hypothetical protein